MGRKFLRKIDPRVKQSCGWIIQRVLATNGDKVEIPIARLFHHNISCKQRHFLFYDNIRAFQKILRDFDIIFSINSELALVTFEKFPRLAPETPSETPLESPGAQEIVLRADLRDFIRLKSEISSIAERFTLPKKEDSYPKVRDFFGNPSSNQESSLQVFEETSFQ